ncbi:hypothetical protein SAMN04489764_3207 [Thermostaphylospora chromogena]|uniref:Uncharacterized protein n=1 Tax=Thermostaphylospora chromogena TaxID=35622 RepID=A0A1H1FV92_9ACTN|nr:hypothetical protein SAMN04489764_3207 [Thermostaphylospora chromogena]
MGNGRYRTVFHTALTPADAFDTARRELRSWLVVKSRHKSIDIAAYDAGETRLGDGIVLLHNAQAEEGGAQTRQWQLRENRGGGYWLSSLVVHAPAKAKDPQQRTWFWIDVEYVRTADGDAEDRSAPKAAIPRIARQLLGVVDARDHWAELAAKPILIRPDRIDDLLEVLTDDERRLPTVVASPHNRVPFDDWRKTIEGVTRFLPGLASLYILDPPAAHEFNREVGAAFGVWGGAVRTYLPGLDLALDEDAARHRVLSSTRIEADVDRSARLLAGLPRRLASGGRLPKPLSRLSRAAVASAVSRSESSDGTASPDLDLLLEERTKILQENNELRELLELADHEERRLRAEIDDLQNGLLETAAELEVENQKNVDLFNLVRTLRKRLEDAGRAEEAYLPAEETTRLPTQLPEVLERLEELDRVEFTGDVDLVWKLEEKAQSSTWAQTTWRVVVALQEYADSVARGKFHGDFRRWCLEPPSGASAIPVGKVKPDESDTVRKNAKMRRKRELPVPRDVDNSGRVYMGAHIRIGGGAGMSAPRLHYYDDVRGTGKIYIGYLGPHLEVKSTN